MKIVTIVENNHVTGVVYGEVEIADPEITIKQKKVSKAFNKMNQTKMKHFTKSYARQK